jgi:hypothetical protein
LKVKVLKPNFACHCLEEDWDEEGEWEWEEEEETQPGIFHL